tara:strand:+ start:940 stop:1161 length:222 start_codon:yes stop_codon:yes gene_type:complete
MKILFDTFFCLKINTIKNIIENIIENKRKYKCVIDAKKKNTLPKTINNFESFSSILNKIKANNGIQTIMDSPI